jgi:predicted GNAT superfamily acetyltransferase
MPITKGEERTGRTRRIQPPDRDIDTVLREDYVAIVGNIEAYWGACEPERLLRLRILHHPMFFEEFASTAFVLRREGTVAAYLLGFYSQQEVPAAYVHLIATHERFRRRGMAAKLFQHFVETAVLHGCESIKAITSLSNRESIAFHQTLGMIPQGDSKTEDGIPYVKDHAGEGEHRVVMSKMLSPVLCF